MAHTPSAPPEDWISDDELAALALAAEPVDEVDDDAVSVWEVVGGDGTTPGLPDWYMPSTPSAARSGRPWRRRIILLIIIAFVVIDAFGLCSTYGHLELASVVG